MRVGVMRVGVIIKFCTNVFVLVFVCSLLKYRMNVVVFKIVVKHFMSVTLITSHTANLGVPADCKVVLYYIHCYLQRGILKIYGKYT